METAGRHTNNLSLDADAVRKILVCFLRDETRNAGFEKGVIGLSGGVDSALAALLAAEALGRDRLLAVIMPYRTSDPSSRIDAELVAGQLGLRTEIVDISPFVDPLLQSLQIPDKVRAGNVMARQRMVVLYDRSSREKGLVIGTSNKTELLLGYGTLFGDMASAINPLGDLYKTQVWQLAAHLGLPKSIVEKKPSADLWAGQTDEAELGLTYERVDQLLYHMIDERRDDGELRAMGFEDSFVSRVKKIITSSQFKRRLPVIAKLSHRTLNVDFRYARDWGI